MMNTHVEKSPEYKKLHMFNNIFYPELLEDLKQRRIPQSLAVKYLKQIYMEDMQQPSRKLHGYAFFNDRSGCVVTVPGNESPLEFNIYLEAPTSFGARSSTKLFVFENAWDFLSWQAMQDTPEPEHHSVILNALSFCEQITDQTIGIRDYIDTVLLFMGNDDAGQQATHYMSARLTDAGLTTRTMQSLYHGYNSFSDYWRNDPDARKIIPRKA